MRVYVHVSMVVSVVCVVVEVFVMQMEAGKVEVEQAHPALTLGTPRYRKRENTTQTYAQVIVF